MTSAIGAVIFSCPCSRRTVVFGHRLTAGRSQIDRKGRFAIVDKYLHYGDSLRRAFVAALPAGLSLKQKLTAARKFAGSARVARAEDTDARREETDAQRAVREAQEELAELRDEALPSRRKKRQEKKKKQADSSGPYKQLPDQTIRVARINTQLFMAVRRHKVDHSMKSASNIRSSQ